MAKSLKTTIPAKGRLRHDVLDLLEVTKEFIRKHPKRWRKGDFAFNAKGESCEAVSPEAKQFCALGFALNRAGSMFGWEAKATPSGYGDDDVDIEYHLSKQGNKVYDKAQAALDAAVMQITGGEVDSTIDYNDSNSSAEYAAQTARDIVKVYDTAIELVSTL